MGFYHHHYYNELLYKGKWELPQWWERYNRPPSRAYYFFISLFNTREKGHQESWLCLAYLSLILIRPSLLSWWFNGKGERRRTEHIKALLTTTCFYWLIVMPTIDCVKECCFLIRPQLNSCKNRDSLMSVQRELGWTNLQGHGLARGKYGGVLYLDTQRWEGTWFSAWVSQLTTYLQYFLLI